MSLSEFIGVSIIVGIALVMMWAIGGVLVEIQESQNSLPPLVRQSCLDCRVQWITSNCTSELCVSEHRGILGELHKEFVNVPACRGKDPNKYLFLYKGREEIYCKEVRK